MWLRFRREEERGSMVSARFREEAQILFEGMRCIIFSLKPSLPIYRKPPRVRLDFFGIKIMKK